MNRNLLLSSQYFLMGCDYEIAWRTLMALEQLFPCKLNDGRIIISDDLDHSEDLETAYVLLDQDKPELHIPLMKADWYGWLYRHLSFNNRVWLDTKDKYLSPGDEDDEDVWLAKETCATLSHEYCHLLQLADKSDVLKSVLYREIEAWDWAVKNFPQIWKTAQIVSHPTQLILKF